MGPLPVGTDWVGDYYRNSGISTAVETSAFEVEGRFGKIRNNWILDQPQDGIHVTSTQGYEITGNSIADASRQERFVDFAPIRISNITGATGVNGVVRRATTDLTVSCNTIQNLTGQLARYGIRAGVCSTCEPGEQRLNFDGVKIDLAVPGANCPLPAPGSGPFDNIFINFLRRPVPICRENPGTFINSIFPAAKTENCEAGGDLP